MMRRNFDAPDWPQMIADLQGLGQSLSQIGGVMGAQFTDRMLWHYQRGTQPLYWRGEALIAHWCKSMGKTQDELPRQNVPYQYRVPKREGRTVVVNLPHWPVAAKPAVQPLQPAKRRGRPPKVKEVA